MTIVNGFIVLALSFVASIAPIIAPVDTVFDLIDTTPLEANTSLDTPLDNMIDDMIDGMTLEEKVCQMFLVRCPENGGTELMDDFPIGGFILFANFFKTSTKEQVIASINDFQSSSSIPMFIAIDEEGGLVNRVSKFTQFRSEPFKSPQALFKAGGFDYIQKDTIEKCIFLKKLGINVNIGPVSDISIHPNDFIYKRTLGKGSQQTRIYVETVVTEMKSLQLGSVLKHFPGYGNNIDTHTGIAYDHRDLEIFFSSDLKPFITGIESGADAILVSHNIVEAFDNKYPASLSIPIHKFLRDDLRFEGVLITDDLVMDGIRQFVDEKTAPVMAVLAGNDLLCCTDYKVQIPAVIKAVNEGIIKESRIDDSVKRLLKWKTNIGLIQINE